MPDPVTPAPVTAGAIPWYRSPVYIGAVITVISTLGSLAPKLTNALGLTNPDAISSAVNSAFSIMALAAGAFTAIKRQTSTGQPLTLTQAAADVHPATVAAVETQAAMRAANIPTAIETQAKIEAAPTLTEKP